MSEASNKVFSKRRWLRFSIRTMLVVVLLFGIWLGWMANRAAKQRDAVKLVKELGGYVVYECEVADNPPSTGNYTTWANNFELRDPSLETVEDEPHSDQLRHGVLGHDWFHDVVNVVLSTPEVTDETLAKVASGAPNLVEIYLVNCSVTDSGLEHLHELKRLQSLVLYGTKVTQEGVERLRASMPDVQASYSP